MSQPFDTLVAVAAPLVRDNIDTDAIIPSREMTAVSKQGLGVGLFASLRYVAIGSRAPRPDFVLNQPAYAGAELLLGGDNFGCGSSREHAAWALADYGFRAVIAPSFNPIFRGNCVRNGIVPIVLPRDAIETIAADVSPDPQARRVTIDLPHQTVRTAAGVEWTFEIDGEAKAMLVAGLDAIDLTLTHRDAIASFRAVDAERRPWAYPPRAGDTA
ncbi:3-isopropylmalate dehydratase small subunit [Sphingomonas glacialis]|uniref:3-isopropylmalate dehydratase small subunit n=1 Tax=Sphingomonas glacialis TaxID=658225 RepID=A0A502FXS4_9SPHN|nr:3-isopropylmalate dehydratase small subunit [Sphingomonas glacialis]TPG54259.1 3-isopropylmalate dehydratase small subunit [Sphingomonas glacialis]